MAAKLSSEERRVIIAAGIFSERPDSPCPECGGYHLHQSPPDHPGSTCPRVKRLVFLGNGNRVEVEYFPNGEWEENVIFTEDVYDDSEEPDDA